MTSGNGLTIGYTAFNKAATITRGTTSIAFDHDPEHQRYAQTGASGITLYIAGGGVLAERFAGSGGIVQWTNYLIVGGQAIGVTIERSDETTATRYFHTDHLGSISVITDENAVVLERLSYDAWGLQRHPDGTPDPAGSITSEASRGFTGHEQLDSVGLVHMNGRVYDPLLARFGTPDPMTENPFSTQGWNRYSYVGNSPLNFTDPSGYCFLGCFWKPIFKAVGNFFRQFWGTILQVAATTICAVTPGCQPFLPLVAGATSAFVVGVTSGDLGLALKAGFISMVTTYFMQNFVADITSGGGFNTPTSTGGPGSWGPPTHLLCQPPSCGAGPLAAVAGGFGKDGATSAIASAGAASSGAIASAGAALSGAVTGAAGASFGQGLLLQGIGAAAVSSLNSLWQQQEIRASNYLHRAMDPCPWESGRVVGGGEIISHPCFGGGGGGGGLATKGAQVPLAPHLHHPWPKYLGGADRQNLVPLPRPVHDAYHGGLDRILPRQRGTGYYQNLSGEARQQMLRDLRDYTRAFDSKYGTKLYDAMIQNGFPLP